MRCSRRHLAMSAALLASLCQTPGVAAQTPSVEFSMRSNASTVQVGDQFQVQVKLSVRGAEAGDISLPDFEGFQMVGRSVSRPMQFSFSFGGRARQHVQSSVNYTLTFEALRPGQFDLGKARTVVAGKTYETNSLRVTVGGHAIPEDLAPDETAPDLSGPATGNMVHGATFDREAFIRTTVSNGTPYEGEQVTVGVYLYTRRPLRSSPEIRKEPSTDGFWVHDALGPARRLEAQQQEVNGARFNVYELKRLAAFPLSAKTLTIGPMTLTVSTGDNSFFSNNQRTFTRSGVPVEVKVKALPTSGRPSSVASVAVGQFELAASFERATHGVGVASEPSAIDSIELNTGDAATLRATVAGWGNIKHIKLALPPVDGLRIYDPQLSDRIELRNNTLGGTRTFEWLIVAERPGEYTLDGPALSTFDPKAGSYKTLRPRPLTIRATGAPLQPSSKPGADQAPAKSDSAEGPPVPRLPPLRTDSMLTRPRTPMSRYPSYWGIMAIIPLLWLGSALVSQFARARRTNPSVQQGRERKELRRRLANLADLATRGDATGFYAELLTTLRRGVEGHLGEPIGGYSLAELRKRLKDAGTESNLAARIVDELEGAEFARYSASGAEKEELNRALERARALLSRLEEQPAGAPL